MRDTLPPKGMCSGSSDLFKFCKISYNISLMVQYRGMVAKEDYRKSYMLPIECYHYQ